MTFTSRSLTTDNINHGIGLWGDRPYCTPDELNVAFTSATRLLAEDRARGALIFDDDGCPRYFGYTVFVDEVTALKLMNEPRPRIGAPLLGGQMSDTVLDERAIGLGNARDGLYLVVAGQGWDMHDAQDDAWPPFVGHILKAFVDVHAGFRLAAIIGEQFGDDGEDAGMRIVRRSGVYPNMREFSLVSRDSVLGMSLVFWLTRREAVEGWSTLLPLFTYEAPVVGFTRQERRLLREALLGATDTELAHRLGMSVAAVKSSWVRLYTRASTTMATVGSTESNRRAASRGLQKRHRLLDFVRQHPSELTPYERLRPKHL
jgi:DNA-binding CsgD family transcriptional regulator